MHDEIFQFEIFKKVHENFKIFQDPFFKYFMKLIIFAVATRPSRRSCSAHARRLSSVPVLATRPSTRLCVRIKIFLI